MSQIKERRLYRVLSVPIGLPHRLERHFRLKRPSISVSAESAQAETCERMTGSLSPEMLTSARLPLSGVDLPRMLRPKSVNALVRRIWTVSTSCAQPRRTDLAAVGAGNVRHQGGDDAGELFERPCPDDPAPRHQSQ